MSNIDFRDIEIDALGEILNISLGASATALSTMLSTRVDITTPVVRVLTKDSFEITKLEPAMAVEITYIEGLTGSNLMILKKKDVKIILELLMGIELESETFELNEMYQSAMCEVMNQMMGASATALSEFLNEVVNISTPNTYEIDSDIDFKDKLFDHPTEPKVVIGFTLRLEDKLESEFMNVMPWELAKKIVRTFIPEESEEVEVPPVVEQATETTTINNNQGTQEVEATQVPPVTQTMVPPENQMMASNQMGTMGMQEQMMQQMMEMQRQMLQMQQNATTHVVENKTIAPHPVPRPNLQQAGEIGAETEENMEMLMGVPLEVSVEIGRTKKLVKDILDLSKGSLVVLDKLAGEQVDLYANGRCIAKGDVVVVEDNFGIRITEIVKKEVVKE